MKQPNKQHRIFINTSININQEICCPQETMHHIKKVLRVKKNEKIIIFNGNGEEFEGHLINRKDEKIKITGLLKKANKTDKKIIIGIFQVLRTIKVSIPVTKICNIDF